MWLVKFLGYFLGIQPLSLSAPDIITVERQTFFFSLQKISLETYLLDTNNLMLKEGIQSVRMKPVQPPYTPLFFVQ